MTQRRILLAVAALLAVTTVAWGAVQLAGDGSSNRSLSTADGATGDTSSTTSAPDPEDESASARRGDRSSSQVDALALPPTTAPRSDEPRSTSSAPARPSAQQPAPPPTTATTTTAPTPPPFRFSVGPVTDEDLGASWREDLPCPPPEELRAVVVDHWGYDGQVHRGRLIVAAAHAHRVAAAMRDIYDARFPIQSMVPVSHFGGDDHASMVANNTSAFNCRYVAGTNKLSEHALGQAIDINPLVNPYVKGSSVDPEEGAAYADRARQDKGMIRAGDAVVTAFTNQGWAWGGAWKSGQDYQHFSAGGR